MIRSALPDLGLTTDIIVGFPGETEDDFLETLEVVDEVGFDAAFTFIYSPRRDTDAALLPDQIDHQVKVERLERLLKLTQRRAKERSERFVGRDLEVMVEGVSRTDETRMRGRTRHSKVVNFDGLASEGDLVTVRIESSTSLTLDGTQILSAIPA
jgi:tRNA-2-methylthio-N6-dimethylallyladenosine synthase